MQVIEILNIAFVGSALILFLVSNMLMVMVFVMRVIELLFEGYSYF